MSMSAEHAEELKNEPAVVCCRTEEGTILSADNLEDPNIFPDMVDSRLLTIPEGCLQVGEVIGAKLLKTIDSLTPLTKDIVENPNSFGENKKIKIELPEEKAVLKNNLKSGDIITLEDLENPMHFEKLKDSLLIELNEKVLIRGEVVGAKLTKDVPAISPIMASMLEGFDEKSLEITGDSEKIDFNSVIPLKGNRGVLRLKIEEGKGIYIEIPYTQL
ncbi:proline reductase [Clostridium sporogenes]|uniref:Proline reductase n=2 Tax=Clostridium TaxID=1485 RepID=A0A6M0T5F7_CLOBO|nr:proline reductase [Clostridium sporogenes]NFA62110.1 proline reductase [Clostridium botulinum]MDS1005384.1 proline reductase [Clostridium sporogenes]NFI75173.1 proline reductase [Clostridium sporogenes]NFL73540.1 proline reductase [Clostridium sporogenes]NFM25890.1 proline reductase [Clostridium sporogenes]